MTGTNNIPLGGGNSSEERHPLTSEAPLSDAAASGEGAQASVEPLGVAQKSDRTDVLPVSSSAETLPSLSANAQSDVPPASSASTPTPAPTPYQHTYQNASRREPSHAVGSASFGQPARQGSSEAAFGAGVSPAGASPVSGGTVPPASAGPVRSYVQGAGTAGGAAPEPPRKKNAAGKTFLVAFAGALVACVLAFGVMGAVGMIGGSSGGSQLGASSSAPISASDEDPTLAEQVASKALPSVVAIDVYTEESASGMFGLIGGYGWGSGSEGQLTESSLGSGVVLTEDGYIITNYHVIEGGDAFKVTIEGNVYDADVVGSDPSSDIAVLKAKDAKGLTPIEIGDSDDLTAGEWVMTLGSPFGLEQSVATGIVSATSRSQIMDSSTDLYGNATGSSTIYPNMIQTDAAINPGNSGGALVDADGKLIGINTLITSYSGNYSGVGFAIPVNYAINLAQQIIDGKAPTHAQLGVTLTTVNDQMAKRYGLDATSGAYVSAVYADSGADAAGIQAGDIITAFEGEKVASASDLMLDVRSKNPGDTVTVTVNRGGKEQDVQVTLGSDEKSLTQQQSGNAGSSLFGQPYGSGSGSGQQRDAA